MAGHHVDVNYPGWNKQSRDPLISQLLPLTCDYDGLEQVEKIEHLRRGTHGLRPVSIATSLYLVCNYYLDPLTTEY